MDKVLIVVDMQNDFITGALGTSQAQGIIPHVKRKIEEYLWRGDRVIFTKDTHYDNYLETHEGKKLPIKHCIYGTHGWEICDELDYKKRGCFYIQKLSFGWNLWEDFIYANDEIEIVGLCTDICVIANALSIRSRLPEIDITVDASCCAGTTKERHIAALEVMKSCHIDVVSGQNESNM